MRWTLTILVLFRLFIFAASRQGRFRRWHGLPLVLLYLSYVDRDGPHRGLRFDGRVEVGEGPRNGGD